MEHHWYQIPCRLPLSVARMPDRAALHTTQSLARARFVVCVLLEPLYLHHSVIGVSVWPVL